MSRHDSSLSRREFLRGSAGAAAALSMGWNVAHAAEGDTPAAPPADVEEVKFAVIGTGNQGQHDLREALKGPGCRCVAVCDIYPPNLQKGLEIAKGAEGYTDYRKMLERKDIQAVLIVTPLSLHAPMALDALDAGKHVFVEKTMAYTIEECKQIVRKGRETKRVVQVGHQRRYSPLYHHALAQVKQGVIGDVTAIRAYWNRNGSWRRGVPKEYEAKFGRLLNWRLYKEYSGGLMTELATHQFDTITWFLGLRPISVMGLGGIDWYKDDREVWDNVHVLYEYPGGIKVTYQSLCTNAFDDEGTTFLGNKGTLILSENGGQLYQEKSAEIAWASVAHTEKGVRGKTAIVLDAEATTKADKREKTAGVALATGGPGGVKRSNNYLEFVDFFEVVRNPGARQPFASGETGLEVAAVVLKANEAMEKGTRVYFKPEDFVA
ncbi:MAG: Gfo/Idh/MocA family oxidoreductase [Armatimonadota bacterium]|nr:Gfo/Idh/MocA family oxidoreductase [Armatimonadota bacterium]